MFKRVKSNFEMCLFLPCIRFKKIIPIAIKDSAGHRFALVVPPLPH
jgi:hypothetical protein